MAQFLIVDDNRTTARTLSTLVERRGHKVKTAYDGDQALKIIRQQQIDIVVTDLRMPKLDGLNLLKILQESWPEIVVIVVTAHGDIQSAVDAMRAGAFDFVTKPVDNEEMHAKFDKAVSHHAMATKVTRLSAHASILEQKGNPAKTGLHGMIGSSQSMQKIFEMIRKVAPTDANVLILGESGTGKELVARAIHSLSLRNEESFVTAHCAAYSDGVLESELFGHEKGAFTGASNLKIGRFEMADKGTFFLDEIGDIPLATQIKLLRVLQEREFERVGGTRKVRVDMRLVSATNQNLENAIRERRFREDLLYRINMFSICLPPLREHKDDIQPLVEAFIRQSSTRNDRSAITIHDSALQILLQYNWPGNVRELRNIIERALILCEGSLIEAGHLPPLLYANPINLPGLPVAAQGVQAEIDFTAAMNAYEKQLLLQAFEKAGGVKARAAKMLDMDRNRFRYKLEKHGIK